MVRARSLRGRRRVLGMVLQFRGTAHPPPGVASPDVANLTAAELSLTDLGKGGGLPVLYEHNAHDRVGHCLTSWEGPNGELRVSGIIDDARIERSVRSGVTQGLSLGTDVVQDDRGRALFKDQQELSVCSEPRRPGCYIDTVDGKVVRSKRRFSAGAPASQQSAAPTPSHDKPRRGATYQTGPTAPPQ